VDTRTVSAFLLCRLQQRAEATPTNTWRNYWPSRYARYQLGQLDAAGRAYYRAYYAAMRHGGPAVNNPSTFPIACKMVQAWSKSDAEHFLKMAHGTAEQVTMMPGCPRYLHRWGLAVGNF
jgi:hypothetical protein